MRRADLTAGPAPTGTWLYGALAALSISAAASSVQARGLDPSCASVRIQADKPLSERWTRAVDRLCAVLSERGDLDPDSRLVLHPLADGGLGLQLEVADGRHAERSVRTTANLARSVEALLVLPDRSALPEDGAPAAPPPAPPPAATRAAAPEGAEERPKRSLHVKLGLSVIGHVAGVPAYIGGGFSLQAGVRLHSLFFEVSPQWEAQQVSARERLPDFEMHNFGISCVVGLRVWDAPEGAVEVAAGALILMEDQTYTPQDQEVGGTLIDGQITAFARLLWGHSEFRWSVRTDVIIAPTRLSHEARIRDIFPALPSFAVGVSFGVHWEST